MDKDGKELKVKSVVTHLDEFKTWSEQTQMVLQDRWTQRGSVGTGILRSKLCQPPIGSLFIIPTYRNFTQTQ
jgi:hypothetical protein